MIKNKNVLLTGGAGFIGSHLFERLINNSNYVLIIDNFSSSETEKNLLEITKNYEIKKDYDLIRGDLADYSILSNLSTDIDIMFHLAATPGVRISIQNAAKVTKNNIISTVNVFEKALKSDIEKVVIASSSSVYGNPLYTPVDEDHPKNPISPYAVSKLCCEMYADYYFREYNLPVTSLRFYTVYGPRGRPDMAIRIFFNKIMKNDPIKIFGDGTQIRDFTFISDIVDGLILASEIKQSSGEVFNLGCSNPIQLNQLIEKMYKIADRPKNTQYLEKQKGDVRITSSKIDKARSILQFDPKVNIDEGLKKAFEWQKENIN
ncbi:MAG: NAD-dependent epimerase/dehydratase family protein [Promethearchaeota archaeon]|jgi:UDP-glucose 4-epimerase